MHPMRTPSNTELGLPAGVIFDAASAPKRRPGTMVQAASAAALPRKARLVVNPSAMIFVFIVWCWFAVFVGLNRVSNSATECQFQPRISFFVFVVITHPVLRA